MQESGLVCTLRKECPTYTKQMDGKSKEQVPYLFQSYR